MQKFTLIICLSLICNLAYADGKKIVKWVDNSGVTHYGDSLPTQEIGRNNIEMRNSGVVIKHNIKEIQNEDLATQQQKLAQARKNKVLLDSYTKAEEIDSARDRHLETDQAALQALTQQKQSNLHKTTLNTKTVQKLKAANKPLPPYLSDELKQAQLELSNINKQITQRKLNMDATRQFYAEEKNRFISLKQPADNAAESDIAVNPASNSATTSAANTKRLEAFDSFIK